MQFRKSIWLFTVLLVCSVSIARADGIKAIFVGADYDLTTTLSQIIGSDARFDVAGSGVFDAKSSTPTLALLQNYGVAYVWTNESPKNSSALGDVLKTYVDGGGKVVISTYAYSAGFPLGGGIMGTGYSPLVSTGNLLGGPGSLGTYNAAHPIFAGVSSLETVANSREEVTLDSGATIIGSWSDGNPLVGLNANEKVAALTLYPGSGNSNSGDWQKLVANTLAYTATSGAPPVPEPAYYQLSVLLALASIPLLRRRRARD